MFANKWPINASNCSQCVFQLTDSFITLLITKKSLLQQQRTSIFNKKMRFATTLNPNKAMVDNSNGDSAKTAKYYRLQ